MPEEKRRRTATGFSTTARSRRSTASAEDVCCKIVRCVHPPEKLRSFWDVRIDSAMKKQGCSIPVVRKIARMKIKEKRI
ncbi:hypothetical protein Ngar_c21920 [Candidatus Nitrososphaera gargensis Ga9.2]|uniref:Uncharacterized protein n=1 Tax=Nitrososphaera gargensis (strain Ga9.2) TaxID=1237085 RepID=K0IKR5_NITGG|nr:hypothetical protein [Candidatus Nitrososphaera gargensis]AFU59122.1 hypothetical protein Ngar_c21920 [Candidatus Nitrososphaera gargensis Ga9.2]